MQSVYTKCIACSIFVCWLHCCCNFKTVGRVIDTEPSKHTTILSLIPRWSVSCDIPIVVDLGVRKHNLLSRDQFYMLLIYGKNEQDDLSPEQLRLLKKAVEAIWQ